MKWKIRQRQSYSITIFSFEKCVKLKREIQILVWFVQNKRLAVNINLTIHRMIIIILFIFLSRKCNHNDRVGDVVVECEMWMELKQRKNMLSRPLNWPNVIQNAYSSSFNWFNCSHNAASDAIAAAYASRWLDWHTSDGTKMRTRRTVYHFNRNSHTNAWIYFVLNTPLQFGSLTLIATDHCMRKSPVFSCIDTENQ